MASEESFENSSEQNNVIFDFNYYLLVLPILPERTHKTKQVLRPKKLYMFNHNYI